MADEKLIFPIGFDLEEGVKQAEKEWKSSYQKQLQKAVDAAPLKAKIELDAKGLDLTAIREYTRLTKEQVKSIQKSSQIRRAESLARERERVEEERVGAAKARRLASEERLTQVKQRSTQATHAQNAAYKTQSGYLQRLFQRMVAYASVTQAFSFIRNIRDVTAQFELQRVALGSIIGDLNEANAMFEQIKAAAVKSPFQIKELVTYTKQLAAYKIETDELFETTQKLADVSAGLGVGMERLVLAYGQIRATGYLRASEVRQLTEAGIPIVEELAKKMSQLRGETVSAAEVMGMISERAISFGMVKEVFDDMTSAGGMFYKMQEKQAETLAGQWSNLQDSIAIMYDEIGNTESVNNAMKGIISLIKSLAENWRDVYSIAQSLSVAMGVYYVVMKNAAVASKALSVAEATRLSTLRATTIYMPKFLASTKLAITLTHAYRVASIKSATATGLLSKAFWGLTKAMLSNPYTAVLAALAGLATLLLTTESRAKRLSKELAKIGKDGAIQIDQSARNFERLAKAIRESEDGSEKQTAALAELRRSYGELLPSQDKEIKALVQEKANYDSLIKSIKRKIELQLQEQKINKIASEYGSRISTAEGDFKGLLTRYGLTEEDADRVTAATKKAIDEGLISAQKSAKENARELSRILEEETGLTKLKDYFDPMDIFTERYGRKMRSQFESLVEVVSEYNTEIDKVGGTLDKLDGKGKKLSDTFNTWQKELATITEGKNLKGEGIRLFDDESISQINKLTDATARVAEEYDKLAKEKKEVDKALLSEGARADKDTYAKLQERLGKINEGMSGLYDFLKKYGALDLIKSDDKGQKSAYQALKDELAAVEKIYKRYQDLRKLKSETDTQSILAKEFKGVSLNTLSKAYSPEQMLAVYEKALAEAQRLGKKDLVLEIQTKIGEFNVAEEERKLEKRLKDLSDSISRTKTAKEFFDRMLGMTGDKEFSASLTLSVYGEGGEDLGTKLAQQTADAFKAKYKGINFSKTAISDKGVFDWDKILTEGEKQKGKFGTGEYDKFLEDVDAGRKASAKRLETLMNELEKTKTYSEKLVDIYTNTQERLNAIDQEVEDDAVRKRLKEQVKALQTKEMQKLQYESFKDSPMYVAMFENLDATSTAMLTNMRNHIVKLRDAWKEGLDPTQLKELQSRINEIDKQLATRNPFKGIVDGIKEMNALGNRKQDEQSLLDATIKKLEAERAYQEAVKSGKPSEEIERLAKKLGDCVNAEDKAARKMSEWDDATQKVMQGMQSLGQVTQLVQTTTTAVNDIVEAFGGWGDATDEEFWNTILDGVNGLMSGVQSAGTGVAQIMAGDILGGVTSLVSGIGSIVSAIGDLIYADQIRQAEKEIERQQELLDSLAYSYERLEKAQEKAFGRDYISNYRQQLANLEATQDAYLKQAELERSKGKKADVDKIGEYEEAARDTADSIADMYGQLSEHFLGADLASAARDFAVAWIDAYKEFANTTDAMKAKFQDMIQNMVVESLLAKVMERALKPVFDMIDDMGEGDFYNPSFWQNVMSTMQTATENGVVGAENVMSMLEQMGINLRGLGGDLTGISRDIATASEESILGLAAGINTQNFYISQVPPKLDIIISLLRGEGAMPQGSTITLQDLVTLQNQHLSYLPNIAQNTADTVARCERAAVACENMAEQLGRVIKPNGTPSNYKLHTTINS